MSRNYIVDYHFNKLSRQELENYIKTEGKRVNQRFRQLEQSGYTEASQMYQYNQSKAFDNTKGLYKVDKNGRFSYTTATKGKSFNQLVSLATEIHRSEQAKSGTVRGIKASYKQGVEKINKKYSKYLDNPITAKELGELFRVAELSGYDRLGSDEVIKLMKKTNLSVDELVWRLEQSKFTDKQSMASMLKQIRNFDKNKKSKSMKHRNK